MSILVIAEKPSVSRELAKVLGADQNRKTHIDGSGYMVSWCLGHLVGLKYPNDYGNNWSEKWSFSQLPMIPSEWLFKVSENTKEQFHVLKDLMSRSDVTEIICATDADREGECIFRYVYHMAKCRKPVKRLWVSSLEESAIRKALADMKPMCTYDNLYHAGYSRAKADWLVGMNASRLFSVRYHLPLNIGRVQTPTLAMIVKRDFEVNHFVKQKYFTCELDCGGFTLSSARMDEENTADILISACNGNTAVITSVNREIKSVNPPKLYDLTTLQRDANKIYGYTAQQTLQEMMKNVQKDIAPIEPKKPEVNRINPDYYKSLTKDNRAIHVETKEVADKVMSQLESKGIAFSASERANGITAVTVSKSDDKAYTDISESVKENRAVRLVNADFFQSLPKEERATQRMTQEQAERKVEELSQKNIPHSAVLNGEKSAVTVEKKNAGAAFMSRDKLKRSAQRISSKGKSQERTENTKNKNQEMKQ